MSESNGPLWSSLARPDPVSRAAMRAGLGCTGASRFLDLNPRGGPDDRTLADVAKLNVAELETLPVWRAPQASRPWSSASACRP